MICFKTADYVDLTSCAKVNNGKLGCFLLADPENSCNVLKGCITCVKMRKLLRVSKSKTALRKCAAVLL